MVDQTPMKKAPAPVETMRQERAQAEFDVRRMTFALGTGWLSCSTRTGKSGLTAPSGGGEKDVLLKEKFMKVG